MKEKFHLDRRLAQLMYDRRINASILAKEIGVTHVTIGNFLKGQLPKSEHLRALSVYFGVSMESLLGLGAAAEPMQVVNVNVALDGAELESLLGSLTCIEEEVKLLKTKVRQLKR